MGNIGFGELLLILLVLLLIFGTSKLPALGDALGKGIRNFKKSATGDDVINVTPAHANNATRRCGRNSASTTRNAGRVAGASCAT